MKKFRTIALSVLVALPLLLALLAAFTQTQTFRNRLRAAALAELDSVFDADIYLGPLGGNILTGFSIDSASISLQGRTLLRLSRLEISYNLLSLTGKTAAVKGFTLVRPEIFLVREKGEPWNISRVLRHHAGDTTAGGPFNWTIDIARLDIRQGTISLVDSASLSEPGHETATGESVEYHQFTLSDVNLSLSANIRRDRQRAIISSCSFISQRPQFRLEELSGVFTVSPSEARVDSLIVRTDKTTFALGASMKDVNLFGGLELRSLRSSPVELSLRAAPIDFTELREFLTPLHFMAGKADVTLEAAGEFGNLTVRHLDVHTGGSQLYLRGTVGNLHDPRRLALSAKISESTIVPGDVHALLPGLHLPDLEPLGQSTLNLEYDGTPLSFRTKFLLETAAGKVQSSGLSLDVGGESRLTYDGTVGFRGLNLGRALSDERLSSTLNGTLSIKGSGVDIAHLASRAALEIDSSRFRGLPLVATGVHLEAQHRAIAAHASLGLGQMQSTVDATLQEPAGGRPAFHVEANLSSLNLEPLLHDTSYNSDITLTLLADGTGLTWKTVSGTFSMDFSSSRYRDYTLDQGNVNLSVDQHDSTNKHIELVSNVADLTLSGRFNLPYMVNLLEFEALNLRGAIAGRLSVIDPSLASSIDKAGLEERAQALASAHERLDARYVLRLKDLEPLSVATGNRTFDGTGLLEGTIRGSYDDLSFANTLHLEDFFYGSADSGVLLENANAKLNLRSLKPIDPLAQAEAHVEVHAGRVHLNRNTLDSLDFAVDYGAERAGYTTSALFNGAYRVASAGSVEVDSSSVRLTPQSLELSYEDYQWRADSGATLRLSREGAGVSGLIMRRDSQAVELQGTLTAGRSIDCSVDGSNLDLDGLKYLLSSEELGEQRKAFAGIARVHATARGTLFSPVVAATVRADDVTFRTLPFGGIGAELHYERGQIDCHARVTEMGAGAGSPPIMTVDGNIPAEFGGETPSGGSADSSMNLHVVSHGVQMSVLDPLLPTFNDLVGLMSCDLTLGGTLRHPSYVGTIGIAQCSFLFVPNNISYTLEGTFHPEGERIRVTDCVIRNVPSDESAGRKGVVHLGGDFALRNLRPGEFNLTAEGQLLVVKETTEKSSLAVSGNLFVEIGPGPLRFTGEIENSLLKGSLLVRNSSLVFPPTQATVQEESAQSVPVVTVDDTARPTVRRDDRSAAVRYFAQATSAPGRSEQTELHKRKSFMDGLHYDLDIEATGGTTEIRMIFNPATNEELVASFDGRFTVTGDGTRWTGDLTIARAYYNFFKRFDATGSIRYTGDFLNPELNIVATYQGSRTLADSTAKPIEKIVVTATITGTRNKPKLEFSMTINDVDYATYNGPKSKDLQSDAIS
ncbi:MAG TPA: translocation/assembly module TamB domain-containing protein, partial [Bacteroidota bacterium]|nr:translocation/assembly module TamB domain-containing protein [Bacteroidota bacterium]